MLLFYDISQFLGGLLMLWQGIQEKEENVILRFYFRLVLQVKIFEMKDTIQKVIEHESQAILNIPIDDGIIKAIDLIYNRVHLKKGSWWQAGWAKQDKLL